MVGTRDDKYYDTFDCYSDYSSNLDDRSEITGICNNGKVKIPSFADTLELYNSKFNSFDWAFSDKATMGFSGARKTGRVILPFENIIISNGDVYDQQFDEVWINKKRNNLYTESDRGHTMSSLEEASETIEQFVERFGIISY